MVKRTEIDRHIDRQTYASLPRHPLIVCASLVQNPANLGGLCRTVEAFRLASLVLAEQSLVQTSAFRNLAASSYQWQPIEFCPLDDLPNWVSNHQNKGYFLIALDANPAATPLTQFAFPKNSVLLLGQELTGIPKGLLEQCDRTVTIPQYGFVESFNVQTAAAIAIYEYMRQWGTELSQENT